MIAARPTQDMQAMHTLQGFAFPELLAALLIFTIVLLGSASTQSLLLRHQQSLWRDARALYLSVDLEEQKKLYPSLSCTSLARREIATPAEFAPSRSWSARRELYLPGAELQSSDAGRACSLQIKYPRPLGNIGELRWE